MRKNTLLILCLPVALQAQTTFAPIGAKWTYTQGSWAGPDTTLMVLEVVSDTLIGGRTFSKVQVNEGWLACHEHVRYYSETNDSLFYYEPDSGRTQLLFRWNANIGESWSTPIEQVGLLDTLDWTVLDTSQVLIDGVWLRRLSVNVGSRQWFLFSDGGTFTERIGGLGSPFTWFPGVCDGETFLGLRCYEDPVITWQNPQVEQCDLSVGIEERNAPVLVVTPTMSSQGEPIRIAGDTGILQVLDATGRVISTHSVIGPLSIELRNSGAYLLRLASDQGGVAVGRVVVF